MAQDPQKVEFIGDRASASAHSVKAEDIAAEITRQLGDQAIAAIYEQKILTQRTRRYELKASARNPAVEILHTLLGIELKIGKRRLLCPDLATARYLSVFALIGCDAIAVPYDITKISRLADELQSSWHRMLLLSSHFTVGRSPRLQAMVRRKLVETTRNAISHLGGGAKYPQFNQKTKQRS
jgi:hypothetical protein